MNKFGLKIKRKYNFYMEIKEGDTEGLYNWNNRGLPSLEPTKRQTCADCGG